MLRTVFGISGGMTAGNKWKQAARWFYIACHNNFLKKRMAA
jgi:hypothetical protein